MPKKRKEPRTCHDCGLESIDDCEMDRGHLPYDENLAPCLYCKRNPEKPTAHVVTGTFQGFALKEDFYAENWTLLSDRTPTIEDPNPLEQNLLKTLHIIVNGGNRVGRK